MSDSLSLLATIDALNKQIADERTGYAKQYNAAQDESLRAIKELQGRLDAALRREEGRQRDYDSLAKKLTAAELQADTWHTRAEAHRTAAEAAEKGAKAAESRLGDCLEALELWDKATSNTTYPSDHPIWNVARLSNALRLQCRDVEIPARKCGTCWTCLEGKVDDVLGRELRTMHMILCETCGCKRCPHATDCQLACTDSNEPGQPGSRYQRAAAE